MKTKSILYIAVLGGALSMGTARAGMLTFDLDVEFSGATPPAGTAPWISATFDDSFGGANTVRLTMSATNLVGVEFIDDWYFNFDPALNPNNLSFALQSGQAANGVSTGFDAFQADGDGKFDIKFDYPPPPGSFAAKFTAGETSVYHITYTSAIDVNSFNFPSVPGGGQGTFLSAAHVQGIGATGNDSGWIGPGDDNGNGEPPQQIPEPGFLALFGIGLMAAGATGIRRRRRVTRP